MFRLHIFVKGEEMKQVTNSVLKVVILAMILTMQGRGVFAETLWQNTTAQTSAKVEQWLKQAGFNSTKAADNVWLVKSKGNALQDFNTLIATNEGVVVIGVVMANKKDFKMSQDLLFKILKLAHDIDFIKIGFDNDDDLFVRLERKVRLLDFEEFKACYGEVTAAADTLFTGIKPFLNTKQ
jgi:hypothetical protein